VNLEVADWIEEVSQLSWSDLAENLRQALENKLAGLWDAPGDQDAFDALSIDKQQALILIQRRLHDKGLWQFIRKVTNVYGEGGVGIEFIPAPELETTLARRKDFTRRFAKHRDTTGGFYEKGRSDAALHFLYEHQSPPKWYVHFDLYSPVHSPGSAFKHFRLEYFRKIKPDWRVIRQRLSDRVSPHE
jgi:hypothetical protein